MKYELLKTSAGLLSVVAVLQGTIASPLPSRDPIINLCSSGSFALTFDQGPGISTGIVLDALMEHNVKATFHPVVTFLNEAVVVANLQRAAEEGHLIGLSLEEDFELDGLSDNDLIGEIDERAEIIKQKIGYKPVYLRIPNYKKLSSEQMALITKKGYIISTYNIDSYDYGKNDILGQYKLTLEKMSPNTKGGFISVQRDYLDASAEATGEVIQYIIDKGYNLVTLDQCAKSKIKDAPGPKGLGPIKQRESSSSIRSIFSLETILIGTFLIAGVFSFM